MYQTLLKKLFKRLSKDYEKPKYFIRSTESGLSVWLESLPNFKQLAEDHLDSHECNCSVYALEKYDEEGLILAAHTITFMRSTVQDGKTLRISLDEIIKAGLFLRKTPGGTGVAYFDNLHWEIFGPESGFTKLASSMHSSLSKGKDKHRVFKKDLCKHFMAVILNNPLFEKNPDATEFLKKALKI
jgi:hypothetical protein